MYLKILKYSKYLLLLILISGAFQVNASAISGTIDSTNYIVQVCEDTSCTETSTSSLNFGNFTTSPSSNVAITDSELTGYIWGESFGWAVLNCSDTSSGCSATNGNFKVANDSEGNLSGYGWGETAGWINFGPFTNSATSSVVIDSSGQFNGYAWAENFGWIKFDCPTANYCVETDWRPQSSRMECADGIDNDSDGKIDSLDSGCHTDGDANNSGSYDLSDDSEYVPSGAVPLWLLQQYEEQIDLKIEIEEPEVEEKELLPVEKEEEKKEVVPEPEIIVRTEPVEPPEIIEGPKNPPVENNQGSGSNYYPQEKKENNFKNIINLPTDIEIENIIRSGKDFIDSGVGCIVGVSHCFIDRIDNDILIQLILAFCNLIVVIYLIYLIHKRKSIIEE